MNLSTILLVLSTLAKLYAFFDDQRLKQTGRADANAEANAEQLKRIQVALAARLAPDPYIDPGLHDPDRRD